MRLLISGAFFAALLSWSAVASPIGWLIWGAKKISGKPGVSRLARAVNWLYGRVSISIFSLFFDIKTTNPDAAKDCEPCIIVCNHQSALDLYLLCAQNDKKICPVTKLWPFRLLFPFAPAMDAAGYINVEGKSAEEINGKFLRRIKEGATLVFYPEGQRSRDGKLGKFHSGAFLLALRNKLSIAPMVITGSGEVLPPNQFSINPRKITVKMLPAITPKEFEQFEKQALPHRALMKHVRKLMEGALNDEN